MANQNLMATDLTTGKIFPLLIRFSIPFMLSNALQIIYSLVDMLVVGQYLGSVGITAVSISSQLISLLTTVCIGLATGGQVYISQLVGAKQQEAIRRVIGTLFTTMLIIGVVMMAISIVFRNVFLDWLETPQESFAGAGEYMLICGIGMLFIFGYNVVSAILRGMGDSKHPLIFIAVASVLNLILDVVFVGPLHMGVAGAAWATIIGQAVSFITSIIFLYRRKEQFGFDFKLSSFAIDRLSAKVLIKLGIPFAISSSAINLSVLFVNGMINVYGLHASATFGVGTKVLHLPDILARSVNMATSTMVGQNFGAGKQGRVTRTVWTATLLCAIIYLIAGIFMLLFPEQLYSLFTDEREVLDLSEHFIRVLVLALPGFMIMVASLGLIQGIGNANFSLIMSLLDGFVMRMGLCYLFGTILDFGMSGVFFGYSIATYGTAIPSFLYFVSGRWKRFQTLTNTEECQE